jgi:hypothetical protein
VQCQIESCNGIEKMQMEYLLHIIDNNSLPTDTRFKLVVPEISHLFSYGVLLTSRDFSLVRR